MATSGLLVGSVPASAQIALLWPYLRPAYQPLGTFLPLVAPIVRRFLPGLSIWRRVFRGEPSWVRRLIATTRRFPVVMNQRVAVRHAPELEQRWLPELALLLCQSELDRLTRQFDFSLRRTVTVYILPNQRTFRKVFRDHFGGAALTAANSIVIIDDGRFVENVRHELAHLFAAQWNKRAPPLINEGLSTWLQHTEGGRPNDELARYYLTDLDFRLTDLLDPAHFYEDLGCRACYAIAGSFTGYLVRRFGWSKFSELFRNCDAESFHGAFEFCLGLTLAQAEGDWHREIGLKGGP